MNCEACGLPLNTESSQGDRGCTACGHDPDKALNEAREARDRAWETAEALRGERDAATQELHKKEYAFRLGRTAYHRAQERVHEARLNRPERPDQ